MHYYFLISPLGGAKYPNWFPKFKQACYPTTKLALFRHTAVDRGFFKLLCDLMRRLERHQGRFPNAVVQRQAAFFVTTILGGLEHCGGGNVNEEQVMHLLPVLLAALKAASSELVASGQILLSYLLARATFKAKTAGKIMKAVRRLGKKGGGGSQETLMLAVLLVRTQLLSLERPKTVSLIVSFEPAVNALLNEAKSKTGEVEGGVLELADSLLYTLGLLVHQVGPLKLSANNNNNDDDEVALLNLGGDDVKALAMAYSIIKDVSSPLSESTVYFVTDLAQKLARTCASAAGEKNPTNGETIAETLKQLTKILTIVEKLYPNEFQQVCAAVTAATGDADIFFLGGGNAPVSRPSEALMLAKRALMDNPLVQFLAARPLGQVPKLTNKKLARLIKDNQRDLEAVLSMEAEFLIDQMTAGRLEIMLGNLLRLLPLLESQQLLLFRLVCSPELLPQLQHRLRLELLLLPLFIQAEAAAGQLVTASPLVQTSGLLAPLLSVGRDHPHRFTAVMAKCRLGLTDQLLAELVRDEVVINSPELVSLILAILLSSPAEGVQAAGPIIQLCAHILLHLPVSDKFEDLADVQNHVSMAKLSGKMLL